MFEKEAEEYANEYGQDAFTQCNMPQWIKPIRMERKLGFQKGAEFGYNKANELHYVKNGALPKFNEGTEIKFLKGRFMKAKQIVICFCENDDLGKVIAWREIVLPQIKEE